MDIENQNYDTPEGTGRPSSEVAIPTKKKKKETAHKSATKKKKRTQTSADSPGAVAVPGKPRSKKNQSNLMTASDKHMSNDVQPQVTEPEPIDVPGAVATKGWRGSYDRKYCRCDGTCKMW
jgi:hypothetical protein